MEISKMVVTQWGRNEAMSARRKGSGDVAQQCEYSLHY
jgi:hypothetical protein